MKPHDGAALILKRSDGAVLCGTRTIKARSWPGTMAFPGGAVDDDDDQLPIITGTPGLAGKRRAAALRESLEEAGVVRVCDESGVVVDGASVVSAVRGGLSLRAALQQERLLLDDRGLVSLGTWLTAEGTFEVTRHLLCVDGDDVARTAPLVDELDGVAWRQPRDLIAGWRSGSVYLLPPIRLVLTRLAAHAAAGGDDDELARVLSIKPTEAERRRRDLVHGVCTIDTRTPTLPPATTTNCIVLGTGDVLLVDPATPFDDERARFDDILEVTLEGRRVHGVFLTHHHPDHIGDAARLAAKHDVAIFCHAETAARIDVVGAVDGVRVVVVDDGHVFDLNDRRFRCVFTPGHAPGHLCLFDDDASLLIAGDMVAGVGSILIDPPEGHMATYLASLDRLVALNPRALIPAHGPLLTDAVTRLSDQKRHRLAREASVRDAIAAGAKDVESVVVAVYGNDTPSAMFAFAARSVAAIVEKLVEDGVVVDEAGGFCVAS